MSSPFSSKTNPTQKSKLLAVSLLLVLSFSMLAAGTSFASAGKPTNTYAFIAVTPNPVGVGQTLQVSFWLADPPPTAAGTSGDRWIGMTVTITKPDGSIESKGPFNSDAVGAAYFTYVPSTIGTYKFQMHYAGGQTIVGGSFFTGIVNNTYLPSDSQTISLVVQQDAITYPASVPLPDCYWARPINGQNTEWSSVSGNWLMAGWNSTSRGFDSGSAYTPEGVMPQSAHVLWTKELAFGGQVGGVYGSAFYHDGRSYEYWFKPPVIISGRLYYNTIAGNEPRTTGNGGNLGITCVDLETGETLFTIANETLSFGQIYNYVSMNQAGAYAYLWTSNWKMYDAFTGQYMLSLTGVPSGTTTFGPMGEIIIYSISNGYLSKWNSSKAIPPSADTGSEAFQWRPWQYAGYTINATGTTVLPGSYGFGGLRNTNGTEWTVPLSSTPGQGLSTFLQSGMFEGNNILTLASGIYFSAYSMKDGSFQYNSTLNVPTNIPAIDGLVGIGNFQNTYENNGIFYEFLKATMQWIAYDVRTGQVKWTTVPYTNAWGMYVPSCIAAYGNFYAAGYDGELHCYNATTGDLLWTFFPGSAGLQTPYGVWPLYSGLTAADGQIIATTSEHGNGVQPLYTGEQIFAVNAYTGSCTWNASGWFEQSAIADGKLISHNCYDNQLYAFGKGPSETYVDIYDDAIVAGQTAVIRGSVTDQSIGAVGTPAIADEYMNEWMSYLYQQQPMPENATGVQVKLTAYDKDNNAYDLGTVTSCIRGNFATTWTPTVTGFYSIIAEFSGTNSYYSSSSETFLNVAQATAATPTPAATETPAATQTPASTATPTVAPQPDGGLPTETLLIAGAVVIIVVAVIAAALVLRKRK